jgi:uncharacterized SAM-binding protein YcdF (DUF218 family)
MKKLVWQDWLAHFWEPRLLAAKETLPPSGSEIGIVAAFPFGIAADNTLGPQGESLVERTLDLVSTYYVSGVACMGGWPKENSLSMREASLFEARLRCRAVERGVKLPTLHCEYGSLDTWQQVCYLHKIRIDYPGKIPIVGVAIPHHLTRVLYVLQRYLGSPYVARAKPISPAQWKLAGKTVLQKPSLFSIRETIVLALYRLGLAQILSQLFT